MTKTKTKSHNLDSTFTFHTDFIKSYLIVDFVKYYISDYTLEHVFKLVDTIKANTNLPSNSSNSTSLRKFNSSKINALDKAIQANSNDEDTANAIEKLTAKAPNMNKNEVIEHIINLINVYNLDVNSLISAAKTAKFAKNNCPNEYNRVHKACCSCSYANECKDNEVDTSKNKDKVNESNKVGNATYTCYGDFHKDSKACLSCPLKNNCINKDVDGNSLVCYGDFKNNSICEACAYNVECINKKINNSIGNVRVNCYGKYDDKNKVCGSCYLRNYCIKKKNKKD